MARRSQPDPAAPAGLPDLSLELEFGRGTESVCGVDEAGRGPWAGPVAVAAVILRAGRVPAGLNDSKLLSTAARERLYAEICAEHQVALVYASARRIDDTNIRLATLWAMRQAVSALPHPPDAALFDGRDVPAGLACRGRAVIGGDRLSLSIAAASIVAKVSRDRLMSRLAESYPGYGFDRHMGYGTAAHAEALDRLGPCPLHRSSFKPVAAASRRR